MVKKRKTELDLDPTVAEPTEPEAVEEAPPPAAPAEEAPTEDEPKPSKRNLYIIGGLVGGVLLLGAIALAVIFGGEEEPVVVEVEEEKVELEPDIVEEEKFLPPVELKKLHNLPLETFTIPYKEEGEQKIMRIGFTLQLSNSDAVREVEENIVVMREAIYFYIQRHDINIYGIPKKRDIALDDLKRLLDRSLQNGRVEAVLVTKLNLF